MKNLNEILFSFAFTTLIFFAIGCGADSTKIGFPLVQDPTVDIPELEETVEIPELEENPSPIDPLDLDDPIRNPKEGWIDEVKIAGVLLGADENLVLPHSFNSVEYDPSMTMRFQLNEEDVLAVILLAGSKTGPDLGLVQQFDYVIEISGDKIMIKPFEGEDIAGGISVTASITYGGLVD